MLNYIQNREYRKDIDGLRAIAVLAVIIFHFGYLPNGYLGVDIFFVISGFLITGKIYRELNENKFSIINFYLGRTRRILPLTLFICLVSLIVGIATMLPDDLENLAQSVIATNFFSNNILQAVTTKNYWDVVNEYKPLMHTWSLGIEEQYYLFYPFLFLLITKKRKNWLLPLISLLAFASIALYFMPYQEFKKFYLIFFRFWELALGGVAAIILNNRLINHKYSALFVLSLIIFILFELSFISNEVKLLVTVMLTLGILVSSNENNKLSKLILENSVMVAAGKISFSLYMWHQLILAYVRYSLYQNLHITHLISILFTIVILSIISYFLIEQPFRNRNKINTQKLLLTICLIFLLTNSVSFYLYLNAGVLKDIPELGISKSQIGKNMHAKYNSRIYNNDNSFISNNKIKVLVIGNSFARDWANVLLESKYNHDLEISYIYNPNSHTKIKNRVENADIIFYSTPNINTVQQLGIPLNKIWAVGTKNFGTSNGIFYNYKGDGYYTQKTFMENRYYEINKSLQQQWGDRYINLIEKVIDDNQMVPVFTPSHKFISQDCRHFTKAGAKYYAQLFESELLSIFNRSKKIADSKLDNTEIITR